MSPHGIRDLKEAMGLRLNWFSGGGEVPGQLGALFNAVAAVVTGLANHVVVFRTVTESSSQTAERRASVTGSGDGRLTGALQWYPPFGAMSASNWIALYAQRYMHEYGLTREQLAQIPITCRTNAAFNPKAIFAEALTLDAYMSARMISWPLCLFDCDVPADGSTAVIVSHERLAADLRKPPVRIEAIGSALHGRDSWDQRADLTTMACHDAAPMMWSRTDLKPSDVDTAQLYDGFSFICLQWLEACGFFPKGEAGAFLEGGRHISRSGDLPLNTNGGQLSGGRMHGYGYVHEACRQLWGEAGERQIAGAEVAVAAAGGGPIGGCMLLTTSR
jgi:acetyl-CoA acetyltransferase